jgi:transcription termination factor Rho
MSRPTRSAAGACAPATPSKARSAHPRDGERYFALTSLAKVNFDDPDAVRLRTNFDNLTPLYPDQKLNLDTLDPTVKDKSARVIDIIAPQGKGQRALIVAPPRTGKTVLLQNIAKAITDNHPRCS